MKLRVLVLTTIGIALVMAVAWAQTTGVPAVNPAGAVTVSGPVLAFLAGPGTGHPTMTVNDATRGETSFVLGPFRYLESLSFSAAAGDHVEALLYPCSQCTPNWVAVRIDNLTNGSSATLRDTEGIPLWAGAGMGPGRGYGGARRTTGRATAGGPGTATASRLGTRTRACGGTGLDMSSVSTVTGTVAAFSGGPGQGTPTLTLHTAEGDLELLVSPYRALAAAGLPLDSGRSLEIVYAPVAGSGGDLIAAISVTDTATGATVQLRDAGSGTPFAPTRGRRGCRQ